MPRAFIHIGMSETGTGDFQVFLRSHREWLKEAGLHVLEEGQSANGAHHFLARAITEISTLPLHFGLKDRAERELRAAEGRDVLLSSESIASLVGVPAVRHRLFRFFRAAGYDIVLLVSIGDRLNNTNGRYAQSTRMLSALGSMDAFVRSGRYLPGLPVWRDWIDTPRVETRMVPYNATARDKGIVPHMLKAIGFTQSPPESVARNASDPGPVQIGLSRWLAEHLYGKGVRATPRQRNMMVTLVADTVAASGADTEVYQGLTPDLADIIKADTRAAMDDLSTHFWDRDASDIFPEDITALPDCNDIDVSEACRPPLDVWRGMIDRVRAGIDPILADPRYAVVREHLPLREECMAIGLDIDAVLRRRFRTHYPLEKAG